MGRLFDYVVMPLLLPFLLLWLLAARLLSLLAPILLFPLSITLNRRLVWACPFIPSIWAEKGWFQGSLMRLGFEYSYTANVVRRFLTLPLRRRVPDFYIVGFPKCGTTSMAAYLKLHPAVDGLDGLHWHETLTKESHFFSGALGRGSTSSRAAYRSYFPTVLRRWWVEAVKRCGKHLIMDATPTVACLDFCAERVARMNPDAKLVFMLRDPVSAAFSAEIMLRNLGVDLPFSFMSDAKPADPRFVETAEEVAYWEQVSALKPGDELPEDLMRRFYFTPYALLRCGRYVDRIQPFLKHFKPENIMFVEFREFCTHPERATKQVLEFVGADPQLLNFRTLPPGMAGERKGRRMHPSVHRKLVRYFQEPNLRLYSLLGRSFGWEDTEGQRVSSYITGGEGGGAVPAKPAPIQLVALGDVSGKGAETTVVSGSKARKADGRDVVIHMGASAVAPPLVDAV
ncbi:sulfotransferase [Chlorella sorokiniana]|uniref:Sulfotransferase n=1 Tax=Chlorella sorokiniana TaxID=3076 RepID=A0A2P6TQL8_CHLSO|nr:sulfotransferase [Chlorella sorokiniana]|eukprot:PRW56323.1 sulfotransferase [Chlorella sorokiniana]